jgi:pantothenate kinase
VETIKKIMLVTTASSDGGSCNESWEPEIANRIRGLVFEKKEKHDEESNNSTKKQTFNNNPLCMVALCGVPGSGKTVSSTLLANILQNQHGIDTMNMSHDGYHYPLEHLKTAFPDNVEDAIYRRGAPDTFDAAALLRDLRRIKGCSGGDEEEETHAAAALITVPGFDHAKGDPEPDVHTFDRSRHAVVICEGLYLLHDGDGWEEIASMFDLTIFIDANVDACVERLKIRNQCIPGYTPQEICLRVKRLIAPMP